MTADIHLTKTGKCAADTICGENRDPKVIWHGQSGAYVMILWLEDNDFAILRSEDISGSFRMTQRITLPHGFECPNLFQIGDNWFIWTAGGYYYPGSFDGYDSDGAALCTGHMPMIYRMRPRYIRAQAKTLS
jgi:fructan beta-fructosidase